MNPSSILLSLSLFPLSLSFSLKGDEASVHSSTWNTVVIATTPCTLTISGPEFLYKGGELTGQESGDGGRGKADSRGDQSLKEAWPLTSSMAVAMYIGNSCAGHW